MHNRGRPVPASGESCLFQRVSARGDNPHVINLRAIPPLVNSTENAFHRFRIKFQALSGKRVRSGEIAPDPSVVRARHMSREASKSPTLPYGSQLHKSQLLCLQAVAAFWSRTDLWHARCKLLRETEGDSLLEELRKRFDESGNSEIRDE